MSKSDDAKKSMFEVAGRIYYEAHVFGYKVSSFTSSGFLDRQGYEMVAVGSSKITAVKENYLVVIAVAVIGLISVRVAMGTKQKVK